MNTSMAMNLMNSKKGKITEVINHISNDDRLRGEACLVCGGDIYCSVYAEFYEPIPINIYVMMLDYDYKLCIRNKWPICYSCRTELLEKGELDHDQYFVP